MDAAYPSQVSVFKETTDNWCGSYTLKAHPENRMLVLVSFYNNTSWKTDLGSEDNFVRVCAWGNDDAGLEKDFTSKDIGTAWKTFMDVVSMKKVNMRDLIKLGFVSA